jgi:hypothetical protein
MSIIDDLGGFLGDAAPILGAGAGAIFGGPAGMAIGGQLGGALSGFLNSREASNVSAEERKKLEALLAKVQMPNFDPSKITPEEFKVVGQYTPQVAQYVQEANPTLIKGNSADQQAAKDAQRQVLQQMISQSKNGEDVIANIQRARAEQAASGQAASNRASLDDAMQRRGMGAGSGLQYAAALQGNAAAAQQQAASDENALMAAEQRRQQAGLNAANLGGQIFNRDNSMEQQNANTINDFNRQIANSRNQYNQYAAGVQNQGQQYNLGNAQTAADKSIQARNQAQQQNLERGDKNAMNTFGAQKDIYNAQANISNNNVKSAMDLAKQKNSTATGIGDVASTVGNFMSKKQKDPYSWEGGY